MEKGGLQVMQADASSDRKLLCSYLKAAINLQLLRTNSWRGMSFPLPQGTNDVHAGCDQLTWAYLQDCLSEFYIFTSTTHNLI